MNRFAAETVLEEPRSRLFPFNLQRLDKKTHSRQLIFGYLLFNV